MEILKKNFPGINVETAFPPQFVLHLGLTKKKCIS